MRRRLRRWRSGPSTPRGAPAASEETADVLTRCASMLRGGVPPEAVFAPGGAASEGGTRAPATRGVSVLGEAAPGGTVLGGTVLGGTMPGGTMPGGTVLDGIGERIAGGASIAEAIAGVALPEWRLVAAAWSLAEETGSPLAPALERIAAALRARTAVHERQGVLLAGPRATVRLVLGLPPLVLGLGWLLGFNPMPVLLSPLGAVLLAAGGSLLAAGAMWSRWLIRGAARDDRVVGGAYELLWIALGSGRRPDEAVRSVVHAVDRFEVRWVPFDDFLNDAGLQVALRRVERLGIAVRPALLDAVLAERTRTLTELERSAERLGVRILGPLGACVLPSFMVMGVVPVVVSMLGGGGSG